MEVKQMIAIGHLLLIMGGIASGARLLYLVTRYPLTEKSTRFAGLIAGVLLIAIAAIDFIRILGG